MRRLALAIFGTLLLSACGGGGTPGATGGTPKAGGTLKISAASENRTLDPVKSSQFVERRVYYNMYESLVAIDDKLNIKPQLATSWQYTDPKTLVFTLRTGVKFHDGTDFNADAVKFNIDRILKAASSPRKSEVASVDSVEVKDPKTVVFHLKRADAALLAQLVDRAGMILSPAAVQKIGDADLGRNPAGAGTGPFMFVEWKRDDHLTLKKNPNYWRQGLPYLDEVIFRPITNTDAALAALKTGDIDITDGVAGKDVAAVKADSNLIYKAIPALSFFGIRPNRASGPLADMAKAKAVALAIDRSQILKNVLFNVGVVSYGPIPPPSWAFDTNEKIYDKADPTMARASATGFSFNLKTTNSPDNVQEAQLIQSQLAKAGITVNIQQEEFGQILNETEAHNFDAALLGWSGRIDPDGNMYGHFHTGGGFNDGQYSNKEVDKLLEDARTATDQAKRKDLYQRAQKILVDEVGYVFVNHGVASQVSTVKVHNFPLIADNMPRLTEVWKG